MDIVNVDLGARSYPIFIGSGILGLLGEKLKACSDSRTVALISNPTVAWYYKESIVKSLNDAGFDVVYIEIPDGEEYKILEWAAKIYDRLVDERMDRRSSLIALGGGVIGDITGFVAATYLRGVPFVQVPTTLLAQVDSSVGGKTGVNHPKGKNLIGAFYQPLFVLIDVKTLATLEKRELKSGLAEVVKYGIIKNKDLFKYLEDNAKKILELDEDALTHIIKESCCIKADVVASDEKEEGLRAILNFGHTFGHAVESVTNYKEYRHGEAVSIGMLFALNLSSKMGLCAEECIDRLENLLNKIGLPTYIKGFSKSSIMSAMKVDKKVVGGNIRFILARDIGSVFLENVLEEDCEALIPA